MYSVQSRCQYTEQWREYSGWTASFREAEQCASEFRRFWCQMRVIAADGRIWQSLQPHRPLVLVRTRRLQ